MLTRRTAANHPLIARCCLDVMQKLLQRCPHHCAAPICCWASHHRQAASRRAGHDLRVLAAAVAAALHRPEAAAGERLRLAAAEAAGRLPAAWAASPLLMVWPCWRPEPLLTCTNDVQGGPMHSRTGSATTRPGEVVTRQNSALC